MELDWKNLSFGYLKTDYNIRSYYRNGSWSEPELTSDETVSLHMAATCLHYGQEVFEGQKALSWRGWCDPYFPSRRECQAAAIFGRLFENGYSPGRFGCRYDEAGGEGE